MDIEKNCLKVAIIGTNGLPAKYGGFETLVEYLTRYLGTKYNLSIYCSKTDPQNQLKEYKGAKLIYLPLKANNAQSIIYDAVSIIHAWFYFDILLVLGCSGCIILPFKFLFKRKKIILNLGGLDWQRSKWNLLTRKFLKFSEYVAVKLSDIIISDNTMIAEYIKNEYDKSSIIIEYGGDQAFRVNLNDLIPYNFLKSSYYLTVARIQPDNNLEMMLEAFSKMPDKNFVLISNWNYNTYGKLIKRKYSNFPNLYLIGPIYDQKELNLIRSNCYAYIHGHSAGGTNPALVEAMFLALPIITYDVSFNRATTEGKAEYFKDGFELIEIISSIDNNRLDIIRMDMKEIADKRYLWAKIASKYSEVFEIK
jgi:glycosyltransferase involved in cell wall biosynthesis